MNSGVININSEEELIAAFGHEVEEPFDVEKALQFFDVPEDRSDI